MNKSFITTILSALCLLTLVAPVDAETLSIGVSHSEFLPTVPDLQARVAVPDHYQKKTLQGKTDASTSSRPRSGEAMVTTPVLPTAAQKPAQPAPAPGTATLARPIVEWFPIPPFMAGIWSKRGDLTTSVTDLRTGISEPLNQWTDDELTVTYGHQPDKLGNVWHANLVPTERDALSAGKAVKFLMLNQKLESTASNLVVTRTHYIVSESYGAGAAPSEVFQQESLNRYQIVEGGMLQNDSTNRVFTYQGLALRDGTLQSKYISVGQFSPTPSLSGIDLAQSLKDYLISISRSDLVR